MNICPKCSVEAIPGAKFCHRCGDKFTERTKRCPSCQGDNPLSSVFCHHCGFHFEGQKQAAYQPRYVIDFSQLDITPQVKALFFASLRKRVEEELDITRYSEFVERFYQSHFREVYDVRSAQIARDITTRYERFGDEGLPDIDQRIDHYFEGLLDYFIIQYCPDLHGFILPEAILRHEQSRPGKTDIKAVIADYLDLEREDEAVYANFVAMPNEYLVNACKNFLFAHRREKVYFILDLSVKGNCKEGFAMTDKAIYWKMPFEKPQSVSYSDIETVTKEKDWLLINNAFFTASSRINLKLCKLLKKIKGWKVAEPAVAS